MNKLQGIFVVLTGVLVSTMAQAQSSAPSSTAESVVHPAANVCGYNHDVRDGSYISRYNASLQLSGLGSSMVCALPVQYDRYIERVVLDVYYSGVSPRSCSLSYVSGTSGGVGTNNSPVQMTLNTSANVKVWQYDNFGEVPAYNGGNPQNILLLRCSHWNMSSSQFARYGAIRIDYSQQN